MTTCTPSFVELFFIIKASNSIITRWMPKACAAFAHWMHANSSDCQVSVAWCSFPAPANRTSPSSSRRMNPQLPSPVSCEKPPSALIFSRSAGGLFQLGTSLLHRLSKCGLNKSLNSTVCRQMSHANSWWFLLLSPFLTRFLSHHQLL